MHGSWDNTTGHNAPLYANNYDLTPKLTVVCYESMSLQFFCCSK